MSWNAVVVPSTPLLISRLGVPDLVPGHSLASATAGTADPMGEVRALAVDAVRWLLSSSPQRILLLTAPADPANVGRGITSPLGERVGRALLEAAGFSGKVTVCTEALDPTAPDLEDCGVLVVGDGSARRGEKAPGYLDERAFDFDAEVEKALLACSAADLADLSPELGTELLAGGVPALRTLGALPGAADHTATMDYADDPLGVQYWIVRWQCVS